MRICELRQKEVINTCTCRSLGCPIDIEFDCRTSCLSALVLPGPGRFCCLFGRDEFIIPWECSINILLSENHSIICKFQQTVRNDKEDSNDGT